MKLCFIDVETTGLYPTKHGMWQLAAIVMDGVHSMRPLAQLSLEMCPPESHQNFSEEALEVSGKTKEEILAFPPSKDIFPLFVEFLDHQVDCYRRDDKMAFCAFNSRFDNDFVRSWFHQNNHKFFGSYFSSVHEVCVMNKFSDYLLLSGEKGPSRRNLSSVAEYLNCVPNQERHFHDARFDLKTTVNVYCTLNSKMHELCRNLE